MSFGHFHNKNVECNTTCFGPELFDYTLYVILNIETIINEYGLIVFRSSVYSGM